MVTSERSIVHCRSQSLAQRLDAVEDTSSATGGDPYLVVRNQHIVGFGFSVAFLKFEQNAAVLRFDLDGDAGLDGYLVAKDVGSILLEETCVTLHLRSFGSVVNNGVAVDDIVGSVSDGFDGLGAWNDVIRSFDDGSIVFA